MAEITKIDSINCAEQGKYYERAQIIHHAYLIVLTRLMQDEIVKGNDRKYLNFLQQKAWMQISGKTIETLRKYGIDFDLTFHRLNSSLEEFDEYPEDDKQFYQS